MDLADRNARVMRDGLDRHITGNWGEDQFTETYDGMLTLDEYQEGALTTAMKRPPEEMTIYCALGLMGEAGEVAERVKKAFYHGHGLDRERTKEELGDILWYLAVMADALGIPFSEIAEHNLIKLAGRYPDGFESIRSQYRCERGSQDCPNGKSVTGIWCAGCQFLEVQR